MAKKKKVKRGLRRRDFMDTRLPDLEGAQGGVYSHNGFRCPTCRHRQKLSDLTPAQRESFRNKEDQGNKDFVCGGCGLTYEVEEFVIRQFKTYEK